MDKSYVLKNLQHAGDYCGNYCVVKAEVNGDHNTLGGC